MRWLPSMACALVGSRSLVCHCCLERNVSLLTAVTIWDAGAFLGLSSAILSMERRC
jgi:hypothetical protein